MTPKRIKSPCIICGHEQEFRYSCSEETCNGCGQVYEYDEGYRIRLTDIQLATIRRIPDDLTPPDANGKKIELVDYKAKEVVDVKIGTYGHKLWVCIDGVAVLRVTSPVIEFTDMRSHSFEQKK